MAWGSSSSTVRSLIDESLSGRVARLMVDAKHDAVPVGRWWIHHRGDRTGGEEGEPVDRQPGQGSGLTVISPWTRTPNQPRPCCRSATRTW